MPDLFPDTRLAASQPTGLGSAMAGGKGRLNLEKTERRPLDFYPTPPACTHALFRAEGEAIAAHGSHMWEPCGRGGAIARVAAEQGLTVSASDVVGDPDNHVAQANLLFVRAPLAPIVITNPPFALAGAMIDHLLGELRVPYLALLLKTTFWSTDTEERGHIGRWRRRAPDHRWDLTWRPDFTGGNASTMNVSWFVWDDKRSDGHCRWGLLNRHGPVSCRDDLFTAKD